MTNFRIQRSAPIAAAVLLVVCCCWSHLESSSGVHAASTSKPARPTLARLEPVAEPSVERDPFGLTDRPSRAPAAHATAKPLKLAAKAVPVEAPLKLALKATYLCGRTKLAVIDDHDYREGDRVKSGKDEEAFLVAAILADRVLLRGHERTVELTYANQSTAAAAPRNAAATTRKKPAPAAGIGQQPGRKR